jgi:hypothetical protein
MNNITLAQTSHVAAPPKRLMAMTNSQLEAWFGAGGLTVEVVTNCADQECVDCVTVDPAQRAA